MTPATESTQSTESTPPADWTPPRWVAQFNKRQLQWLAVQLQDRQHKARTEATAAIARLAVLEAHTTTQEARK
ncbi:hypothetical protein GCM10009596_23500 [Arthrobacter rhombi]|uniref:hypothetical protein n=1 Tax=Arthrobacter rhombi TaxID=71253 RepID=UPI0031D51662